MKRILFLLIVSCGIMAAQTLQPPIKTSSVIIPGAPSGSYVKADGSGAGTPSGAFNPAAPGPIGGTTPAAGYFTTVAVGAPNPVTIGGATGSCAGKVAMADGTGCVANGVSAEGFAGADWTAKTSNAIASLPSAGGTVFVPNSLAGTGSGGLLVPANVCVQFDAGHFLAGATISLTDNASCVRGAGAQTILTFTNVTDGITASGAYKQNQRISSLTLDTTNASAGKAINGAGTNTTASTRLTIDNVTWTTTGSGVWSYEIWADNIQGSHWTNLWFYGKAGNAVIHLQDAGGDETSCISCFMWLTAAPRGIEITGGVNGAGQFMMIGGGIQGTFSGSSVNVSGGGYYTEFRTHHESAGAMSDGAEIVISGGSTYSASLADSTGGVALTGSSVLNVAGGNLLITSMDSTTSGSVVGARLFNTSEPVWPIGVYHAANTNAGGGTFSLLGQGYFTLGPNLGGCQPFVYNSTQMFCLGSGFASFQNGTNISMSGGTSPDTYIDRNGAGVLRAGNAGGFGLGTYQAANFTQTNGPTWTSGSGAPSGVCAMGSLFSRTDGSATTSLYVCTAASTWTAK